MQPLLFFNVPKKPINGITAIFGNVFLNQSFDN